VVDELLFDQRADAVVELDLLPRRGGHGHLRLEHREELRVVTLAGVESLQALERQEVASRRPRAPSRTRAALAVSAMWSS
jgi:hypothetical protein